MRLLLLTMAVMPVLTACAVAAPHTFSAINSERAEFTSLPSDHRFEDRQINRSNVSQLVEAWRFRSDEEALMNELRAAAQSTPLLLPEAAGAALVYCTAFDKVIALDPATGEQRWRFNPHTQEQLQRGAENGRAHRCRGVNYLEESRVGVGEHCRHRLFLATADRQLWALDALSGKPCENFANAGRQPLPGSEQPLGQVSSSSPVAVAGDRVVVGSAVVDFELAQAPRGTVASYDSLSGELLWQFDPLQGQPHSGGANVWAGISVDIDHRLVFLPTGAPSPDYYGAARPGDNRHANSLVALELDSGQLRWAFQHVHHDLWDFDSPAQPILFNWPDSKMPVPAVLQLTKQGYLFIFNRLTGEPLWPIHERPVPPSTLAQEQASATQPIPIAPPPLIEPNLTPESAWGITPLDRWHCRRQVETIGNLGLFTPPALQPTLMYPGSLGGANWGGGALVDGHRLLVNVNNVAFAGQLFKATVQQLESRRDHPANGEVMQVVMHGSGYGMQVQALTSFLGTPCNRPPWGQLVAVDLTAGTIEWRRPLGSVHEMAPLPLPFELHWGTPNLGGGIATDGGLFFIAAAMDRTLRAFDSGSGELLWSQQLPVDATATPLSYRYRGRQYIVVNAGGHMMFNRPRGDYLIAYTLPDHSLTGDATDSSATTPQRDR
ncbi:pyrroloquinoline quinone-dependent dehydrogenase [Gammaproteobacteria bacterium LSUCC0057]|uniref:Pyrroloquinoline quinone-dependent dehydrogenase n=1 Tax=Gammaproteobacteria bacterium LSUCC0057 TaxID=2559237 RepID=A0A4Y8UJI2_9GAMM|nr:pyrroloquinoline quinone-dependent dehydrogenase [Gammaproteobacteria bacterium LSUCC0057]